ncbi:MAG: 50S ribosomal protein L13 [Anaerolineae bacterium]|nr:50S ribosomal protein L13 [Anaerolineae bacterium]
MKTHIVKESDIQREWFIVDAEGKTLGRLASKVAQILRGKHKPIFSPHSDSGDFVIVVNADKITVTGNKVDQKMYYRHSGYIGGLKERTFREQLRRHPDEIIKQAVKGMLPHNRLGRKIIKKLKVYAGPEHPHQAQQPQDLKL